MRLHIDITDDTTSDPDLFPNGILSLEPPNWFNCIDEEELRKKRLTEQENKIRELNIEIAHLQASHVDAQPLKDELKLKMLKILSISNPANEQKRKDATELENLRGVLKTANDADAVKAAELQRLRGAADDFEKLHAELKTVKEAYATKEAELNSARESMS